MPRRIIVFVVFAVASAALFVRLGFWQLSRLKERRAQNAVTAAVLAAPETNFDTAKHTGLDNKRVMLEGTPVYDDEIVLAGRSRNGSPGVNLLTPVRLKGDSVLVLVNRGWVYAPDAKTVDAKRWRENRTVWHGYLRGLAWAHGPNEARAEGHTIRVLTSGSVWNAIRKNPMNYYLVAQDSGSIDSTPARLPMPALDEGPHLNYAIQWFCFAAIALVGAVIVARRKG